MTPQEPTHPSTPTREGWLVAIYLPISRVPALLQRWGNHPALQIPAHYPDPHPVLGSFTWVVGQMQEDPWFPTVMSDPDIAPLLTTADEPDAVRQFEQHMNTFEQANEQHHYYWADLIPTTLDEDSLATRLHELHSNSNTWLTIQANLSVAYENHEGEQKKIAEFNDTMLSIDVEREEGFDRFADSPDEDGVFPLSRSTQPWTITNLLDALAGTVDDVLLPALGTERLTDET